MATPERKHLDPTRPVAVWSSQDLLGGRATGSLTVILRTVGCSWNRCTMCGYASEGAPATSEDLMAQFKEAMKRLSLEDQVVKIYTSGSFLDPSEVPQKTRAEMLESLHRLGVKKVVIEARPEYITSDRVAECQSRINTEFAMGLETSNDLIRQKIINKGFTFREFVEAAERVHEQGGTVKAYLLLKPPLLSESAAIRDVISSARAAGKHADILSLNLCNVQRGTLVERLWEHGEYRPPWLWSAVEILKCLEGPVICDPVGAGKKRGPHNCGVCDVLVGEAIRRFSIRRDVEMLRNLQCECQSIWQKVMELEESSFGVPLF